jgi:hypothetical protein
MGETMCGELTPLGCCDIIAAPLPESAAARLKEGAIPGPFREKEHLAKRRKKWKIF